MLLEGDASRFSEALERDLVLEALEEVVGYPGHQARLPRNAVKRKIGWPGFVMSYVVLYSKFVYAVKVFDPQPDQRARAHVDRRAD